DAPKHAAEIRWGLARMGGLLGPERVFAGRTTVRVGDEVAGAVVDPGWVEFKEAGGSSTVPYRVIRPKDKPAEAVVVCVSQEGAPGFFLPRSYFLAALVRHGFATALPDLPGPGKTNPADDSRDRTSVSTRLSASQQMLGSTLLRDRIDE